MLLPLLPLLVLSPGCFGYLPAPDSCCSNVEVRGGISVEGHYALDTYTGDQVLVMDDFWASASINYTNGRYVLEKQNYWGTYYGIYMSDPTEKECPENVAFEEVEVSCTPVLPWWTILLLSLAGVVITFCCLYCCYCNRRQKRQRLMGGLGGVVHSGLAQYPGQGLGGVGQSGPAQYPGQAGWPGQVVVEGGRGWEPPPNYNTLYPGQGQGGVAHSEPTQFSGQLVVEGGRRWEPAPNYNTEKI